jgi:hypothetical protein
MLLAVVMSILTSVNTIAGEISSGTIQAIATKPMARWQILVGKMARLRRYAGRRRPSCSAGWWLLRSSGHVAATSRAGPGC